MDGFVHTIVRAVYAREIVESFENGRRVVEYHNRFCPNRHGACMCQYRGTLASREVARQYARDAMRETPRAVDGLMMRAYWLGIARYR